MAAVLLLTTVVLLTLASVPRALDQQERTLSWTFLPADPTAQAVWGQDEDWVAVDRRYEHLADSRVTVLTVGVSGRGVDEPPGLAGWPAPGTARLSPAVRDLLDDAALPPDYFGSGAPGFERTALRGPEDLLVVQGASADQVSPVAIPLTRLGVGQPVPLPRGDLPVVLGLAGVAAVVPPLVLAWTVLRSDLRSARRRLATLALAGTPARVLTTATILDIALVALVGWAAGLLSFWVGRPLLVRLPTWEIGPWASDLRPPAWAVVASLGAPLLVCVAALWLARGALRDPLRERTRTDRPGYQRDLLLAGCVATLGALVLASGSLGRLAPAALSIAAVLLVSPAVVTMVGRILGRAGGPVTGLAGALLQAGATRAAMQAAPAMVACFVLSAFLMMNPAAVASVQTGVISQGTDSSLVRVEAADRATVSGLVEDLRGVPGVQASAAIYVGDVPAPSGRPVRAWFGRCEDVVAASNLPDDLCSGSEAIWGTPTALEALEAGGRSVTLTGGREPEPMNAFPDEEQPVAVTVPSTSAGSLSTPDNSWDLPGLLVDPERAGVDLSWFRPTTISVIRDDEALDRVGLAVNAAVPTARSTTQASGLWGFSGALERYYSQLLTAALGIVVLTAVGVAVSAWAQQVEQARTHAMLHAAGLTAATLRRSVAIMTTLPVLVLTLLSTTVGAVAGLVLLPQARRYALDALPGLVPLLAGILILLVTTYVVTSRAGPQIGPHQLRVD